MGDLIGGSTGIRETSVSLVFSVSRLLIPVFLISVLVSCSPAKEMRSAPAVAFEAEADRAATDRLITRTANLDIEVDSFKEIESSVQKIVKEAGGHLVGSSSGDNTYDATLKVPSPGLDHTLDSLSGLGTERSRSIQTEDVTDSFIDTKARLDNLVALRDRLRGLLDKATQVKDILSIETELARVQGDLDSLQGRLKALQGRIDYATVYLTAEQKHIYGPLGYIGMGIWWIVEKLFVIK